MSRTAYLLSVILLVGPWVSGAQSQNAAPQITFRIKHPLDEKLAAGASAAFRAAMKGVPTADSNQRVGIGETALPQAACETFQFAGSLAPWNDPDESDDGRVLEVNEGEVVIRFAGGPVRLSRAEVVTLPEVLAELDRALGKNAADTDARLARAFAYQVMGDDARAISDLTELVQQRPEVAEYYVLRATRHISVGSEADALADCSHAIRLNPQHSFAYFLRAQGLIECKREDEALFDLNDCIRHDPACYWAYLHRAAIFGDRNEVGAALQDLQCAVRLPKNPPVTLRSAVAVAYMHLDRYEDALLAIDQAIQQETADPDLLLVRSQIYAKLDRADAQREDLLKAADLPCDDPKVLLKVALWLSDIGEEQQLKQLYHRISTMPAVSSEDFAARAVARYSSGKTAEAVEDFTRTLALKPDDFKNREFRAVANMALGHFRDAAEDLNLVLKSQPDDTSALDRRSVCRLVLKDREGALADTQALLALKPDHVEGHARHGSILLDQRHYKEAHAALQRALKLDGKHAAAGRDLTWLLATCPDDSSRNGRSAFMQARWYLSHMDENDKSAKDYRALAAAAAAAGDYAEAVMNQELVVKSFRHHAKTPADHQEVAAEEARLELYKARKPYIEPAEPLPAVTSK